MRKFWIAFAIVVVDQLAKFAVLKTMYRGQSIPVLGDWFKLTFTENPGMAFGIVLGHPGVVTMLSIAATFLILYYMFQVGRTAYAPYRYSLSLVLGGAFGNIIDRVLYGKLLYDEPLFLGRVVDFIHFDVCHCLVPSWVPVIGSHYLSLFPIWNVADMAIVTGVVGIIVFQKRFHDQLAAAGDAAASAQSGTEPPPMVEPAGTDFATGADDQAGSEPVVTTTESADAETPVDPGLPAPLDREGQDPRE